MWRPAFRHPTATPLDHCPDRGPRGEPETLKDDLADALTRAVLGDETGFGVLWRALNPPLLRYLRVVAGEAAEDVASETWLQAMRDLPRFTGDATGFRVWLFRIARNRGIDELRRASRRHEHSDSAVVHDAAGVTPDAATMAIERSGTDWALDVIASLPADQAEAVMLRVVAGLSPRQTAQVLDKRPGAVRVATMRGLRRLSAHSDVVARRQEPKAQREVRR